MINLTFEKYDVVVLSSEQWDRYDDNIDIEVRIKEGCRYAATLFTIQNLASLLEKHRKSGECANGTFVWAVEMIVLRDLNVESIFAMVEDLISTGEIHTAMLKIMDS